LYKKIPFVCYLHIPPPKIPPSTFAEWQWNLGVKGVQQFIAVSNQTKLDWVKSGFSEEKIEVVYNGINLAAYKPSVSLSAIRKEWNIPEDIRVISYVGRLDKEKGLETLIKAFALLLKNGVNARLLIAGKPLLQGEEYKKSLDQLATDLGIEKYISFLGHVANTTSVYQVSDVTVLASRWSEPFGRTIIESMACGTPMVASRTGGIPESLTGEFQNGLFEPENEQDLSDTLSRIMNWRDKDPKLGERCREHILSKFTLEKMVDAVEKVLLKVVKQ
jgi:glycosyltransferase involved in cell wall biosynthesis